MIVVSMSDFLKSPAQTFCVLRAYSAPPKRGKAFRELPAFRRDGKMCLCSVMLLTGGGNLYSGFHTELRHGLVRARGRDVSDVFRECSHSPKCNRFHGGWEEERFQHKKSPRTALKPCGVFKNNLLR